MKTVIWTDLAYVTFNEIVDYLEENFSLDSTLKFSETVRKLLRNLEIFETLCPKHPRRVNYRKCVITRHTSLIYRIENDEILLLSFHDNRSSNLY